MERLSEKEWATETIGDAFSVSGTTTTHPSKLAENGSTPRITCASVNNGLDNCYGNEPTEQGGVLTVDSATVGTVLFQPSDFIATDHVEKISGDKAFSEAEGLFIKTCIDVSAAGKYQYGYKFSQNRIKRQKLMLPVDDKGKPDYAYMTLYSAKVGGGMVMRYKNFIAGQLSQLEHKDIPALVEKEWKPVLISSMFELVRGRENNMAMLEDGDTPLISAKANNNGLKGFVHNPKKIITGQCITLNNDGDGGAGLAYYQPANMALDSHVTALVPLFDMSAFAMLFIAKCISGLHGFFGHGLSISNPRAKRLRIMLPVTDSGEPDYAYMEQYAKNMMLKKYEQYLAFIDRQSSTEEVNI